MLIHSPVAIKLRARGNAAIYVSGLSPKLQKREVGVISHSMKAGL